MSGRAPTLQTRSSHAMKKTACNTASVISVVVGLKYTITKIWQFISSHIMYEYGRVFSHRREIKKDLMGFGKPGPCYIKKLPVKSTSRYFSLTYKNSSLVMNFDRGFYTETVNVCCFLAPEKRANG